MILQPCGGFSLFLAGTGRSPTAPKPSPLPVGAFAERPTPLNARYTLRVAYFIAQRVAFNSQQRFSKIIIRIAIAAIALSVAVMIAATSLVAGFKQEISEKVFGFWGHIQIIHFESNRSFEVVPIRKDSTLVEQLKAAQGVQYPEPVYFLGRLMHFNRTTQTQGRIRQVQVFAEKAGIIKTGDELEGIVLKGIGEDYDWSFFRDYLKSGDTLALAGTSVSNGIVISAQTAARLRLEIGDKLQVHFVEEGQQRVRPFKVTGIYKTGLEEYDKKFAMVDIRQIQQLNGWAPDEVGGYEVYLDHIDDLQLYWKYIYEEALTTDLFAQTIREMYPSIFGWLDLQDINVQFIFLLMIVVAIINMTTALMILIYERTNMIGVLKALGLPTWQIRKIFLYYAAYIIGLGLLWGNGLGLGLCWLQDAFGLIQLEESVYYVPTAPVQVRPLSVIALNIGTLAITLLSMIVPSYLVTRISPLQAVRFK